MRATPNTSPFLARFSRINGSALELEKCTLHTAVAVRFVGFFSDTDTIWALPEVVRCVSFDFGGMVLDSPSSDPACVEYRRNDVWIGLMASS